MKNIYTISLLFLLLITNSCERNPSIRFGFDTEFDKDSQGLSIMYVEEDFLSIQMEGTITVTEGAVLVELINPTGENVLTREITAPANYKLDESYEGLSGNWKLKYKSLAGRGTIHLHLNSY